MNASAFRQTLSDAFLGTHCPAARRKASPETWAMLRLVGWLTTFAVLAFLMWQVAAADPLWPPVVSGFLLILISFIAGQRLSADSATTYISELHRLNNYLADQNKELQAANSDLLHEAASHAKSASESTTPSESE